IIGLTGSFGSGCTYVAKKVFEKRGYKYISLSDALRSSYRRAGKGNPNTASRRALQNFGDQTRKKYGGERFAKTVLKTIQKPDGQKKWVVDSIRNPKEVEVFRNSFRSFFLFGIYADRETRWKRVKDKYNNKMERFEKDDDNDAGKASMEHGQRVQDCFADADVVFSNDKHIDAIDNDVYKGLDGRMGQYIDLVSYPLTRQQPSTSETLMTMAYAVSQKSSCLKRKVGTVIVDSFDNVISSGYNEVPMGLRACSLKYQKCHRDHFCDDFFGSLKDSVPAVKGKEKLLRKEFREKFRILDLCRALHAEENAILNLARNGRSIPLDECTLYTTTYPCRLCANKIGTLGIKEVVYLEPYPDPEAIIILASANVGNRFFEGVTF
ncbi:hypothetical protein LCGC14_2929930, partial [marine sediment metagenome]